jgi:hypothetical protein
MEKIEKILEINHSSFNILKDFFETFDYYSVDLPNNIYNDFVYYDGVSPKDKEVIKDIDLTPIGSLNNQIVNDSLKESIEHLKSIYNIKMMWLMSYPPKTFLNFHRDHGKNRHLVSFNHNERFFSYEGYSDFMMNEDTEMIINEKLKSFKDNIDQFNDYFLNYDESCRISNLDSNCVYVFGNTIHNFINDSNQLRVNLVFEI